MLWKKLRPAKKQQDNVAKGKPKVAINPFKIEKEYPTSYEY